MTKRPLDLLFTFVGGQGHADPLLPIAHAARMGGHSVRFACHPSMLRFVANAGFAVAPIGADAPDEAPSTITPLLAPDQQREDDVLRDGFAGSSARRRGTAIRNACTERRPDVLVADEVDFGAFIAAELLGIPSASVTVLAAGGFARKELLGATLNGVRAEFGLPPDLSMLDRNVIAPLPPSFRDPAFPLPDTATFIRPHSFAQEPADDSATSAWLLPDRPHVYVTLGTIFNTESGDLFSRLLAAVADLDADVLVTTGAPLDPQQFGVQRHHVRLHRYLAQRDVLRGCDLVICHGGSGSVVGAVANGVPVVTLPMGADQPHNGRRCEALGVGLMLDPVAATPASIQRAVSRVLSEPSFRSRAHEMRIEAEGLPGAGRAVELLEALTG